MKSDKKVIIASMVGTALEFYDFTLYGVFSVLIGRLFFSASDPTGALLLSLIGYSLGFFARPLGALLFGHLGDIYGRKNALMLSIIFMAVPTFIMGILPTYTDVGILATFLIVFCRLLQGVCAGGEYNGGAIFMIEHLGREREGLAGSFISFAGMAGVLLAMLLSSFFLKDWMPEWAWRIPFLFGGLLGLVGIYIRLQIEETPAFQKVIQKKKTVRFPLKKAILKYPGAIFICFLGSGFGNMVGQTVIVYLNIYATNVGGVALEKSILYNSFGPFMYLCAALFAGIIYDRIAQYRIIAGSAFLIILFAVPAFLMVRTGSMVNIMLAQAVLCVLLSGFCAPFNAFMNRLFPTEARYSGIALGYGLGIAIFGGTAPFVYETLIQFTGNTLMPAFFLMTAGLVGTAVILIGKRFLDPEANDFSESRKNPKTVLPKIT